MIDHMDLMSEYANQKYEHFRKIWTEYDDVSFWIGMLMTLWLFIFHQFIMFGRSQHLQDLAGITGLTVNWLTYIGSAGFNFYPLWISALVAFIITFGQSRKQRNDFLRWIYSHFSRENGSWTAKGLTYPSLNLSIIIMYAVAQVVDSFIQEQDYVYDGLVLLVVSFLWVTQPPHLRSKDNHAILVIILVTKFMYFVDGQRSMNFETEEHLLVWRNTLRSEIALTQAVPLILCVFLENKITRHYRLGKLHSLLAHGLTIMLFANYIIAYV